MKIGIIGAGNIGTAIAADLGRENEIYIHSSRPKEFLNTITYIDLNTNNKWKSRIMLVTDSYEEVVKNVNLIFVAVPTFMTKITVEKIIPYLKNNTLLGFVPGAGGVEFLATDAIKKHITIFGFERVPYVARVIEYGKSVSASKKEKYRIAAIPSNMTSYVSQLMEKLFDRPCGVLKHFISMTLTPSLHSSRLYDLYKDYKAGQELDDNSYFYREWRDSASYLTFELDKELHLVCDALTKNGIIADEVVPYPIHYESPTPELLTKKLRSIHSLRDIKGPVIQKENGKYVLDIESRYFTESYPYRLCIVKGLADLLELNIPKTDEVLMWYQKLANKKYYVDGLFEGEDIKECNIPQNYGVFSINQLKSVYVTEND